MRRDFWPLVVLVLVLNGCGEGGGSDSDVWACTASIEPGIRIEVVDRETGIPISCGARAILTDEEYVESIENSSEGACFDSLMLAGAFERPGIYNITVSKEGYLDWTAESVEVTSSICHVNTVTLQAQMAK